MLRTLFSTILMAGMLSMFAIDAAAKDKKPKATAVTCGDTISAPGNYFLAADCIGDGITITASKVTLDLKGHTMSPPCVFIFCNPSGPGISVSNVSKVNIIGPGTISSFTSGIAFDNVRNSVVKKVTATGNDDAGISLFQSSGNKIEENHANFDDTGIKLEGSRDNEIKENEATGNRFGITLDQSNDNEIEENQVNDNENEGIILSASRNNEIKENEANGADLGIHLISSNDNHIEGNQANTNVLAGIALSSSSGNEIEENETNGNGTATVSGRGIRLIDSTANKIEGNTALNNSSDDLSDDQANCDNNQWEDNTFVTANQPCID